MAGSQVEMTESKVDLDDKPRVKNNDQSSLMDIDSIYSAEVDAEFRGSGLVGTVMNMTNTVIGSGILSIPFSVSQTGWGAALCLLVLGAVLTLFGLHLMNKICDKLGSESEIGSRTTSLGEGCRQSYPWLVLIADLLVFITLWAVGVIYMTIASSIMPDVMRYFIQDAAPDAVYYQTWFWLLICWGIFAAPLTMLKSVWFLSYTSFAAVVCVMWTTFVVFAYSVGIFDPCGESSGDACRGGTSIFIWNFEAIMRAFPVFLLGFCIGPVQFNIYNTLGVQSVKRMDVASSIAITLVFILYIIISMCGYFTFGDKTTSNILDAYPISVVASIARLGTAFVVTVSYPLLMHASRDSMVHAISTCMSFAGHHKQAVTLNDYSSKSGNIVFYVVATVLNIAAFCFAYFQIDINTLLSITGAIGTVNLSFTLPAIIYWKMFENDGKSLIRLACPPFALLGLICMGISVWANFA